MHILTKQKLIKTRQNEVMNTSARRCIFNPNSPAGIMHGTPEGDIYTSVEQKIMELDRMMVSLKESRGIKSYNK